MTPHISRGYSKHHLPPHPDHRRPLSTSLHNLAFPSNTDTMDTDFTAQWLATSNLPLSITTTSHDNLMSMPKGFSTSAHPTPPHHGMMTPSTSFHSQTEEELLNTKDIDDGRLTRDDLEPDHFASLPNTFHNSPRQP